MSDSAELETELTPSARPRKRSVSVLSLRDDTQAAFKEAGIRTLDQLVAMSPDELRRFKGIKTTAEALHAHARAYLNDAPVWFNTLPHLCRCEGFFFDIETDPQTGFVWSIGWNDGGDHTSIAIVAPYSPYGRLALSANTDVFLLPDAETVWEAFAQGVAESDAPVYHWTGYDSGVMHKTAPDLVTAALENRLYDLHRTFNQCVRFPVRGSSLKTLGVYLGYGWSVYDAWDAAWRDYQTWLMDGEIEHLARACAYQRDDVVALALVWKWLNDNLES
jgi:predicted RecB family nuclease